MTGEQDWARETGDAHGGAAGARHLAAIMFTDIVGYTALIADNEASGIEARDRHRELIQSRLPAFSGRWLEEIGDESFTLFASALDAVNCARAIQAALAQDPQLKLRIGIHMGDVLEREGRVIGDAVNVASRIRALAEPGGIVVSERVWEDVRNHPELGARLLGEKQLKNVSRPVRLYVLAAAGQRPRSAGSATLRRPLVAGAALLALLLAGLLAWRFIPTARAGANSIAVLPFVNISQDQDNEYFSDGMTEELLNALAQVEGLKVPSRTSVFAYKGQQKDIRQIGAELKVQTVLEGSVRKDRDRLRITAQLINVADGYHLWSQTYERSAQDVFAVQNELALAIVDRLRPQFLPGTGQQLVRQGTTSLEAYDTYLRGRFDYFRQDQAANRNAIDLLRQSTALDPNFARAYAALAQAYGNWVSYVEPSDASAALEGFSAAEKALALDPTLGEAHLARGRMHFTPAGGFRFEPALEDLKRALELDRSLKDAWLQLGGILYHVGLYEHSDRAIKKALELAPTDQAVRLQQAALALYMEKFDQSLALTESVPRSFNPVIWHGITMSSLLRLGRSDEAAALYAEFERDHAAEGGLLSAQNATLLARRGENAAAEGEIRRALEGKSPFGHFHHTANTVARAYAILGRQSDALHWLEHAAQVGFPNHPWLAADPDLSILRSTPRFQQLLENNRRYMQQLRPVADAMPW